MYQRYLDDKRNCVVHRKTTQILTFCINNNKFYIHLLNFLHILRFNGGWIQEICLGRDQQWVDMMAEVNLKTGNKIQLDWQLDDQRILLLFVVQPSKEESPGTAPMEVDTPEADESTPESSSSNSRKRGLDSAEDKSGKRHEVDWSEDRLQMECKMDNNIISDRSLSLNGPEYRIREELNKTAARSMVVLFPLKVVITTQEAGKVIHLDVKKWLDAQTHDTSAIYKVPYSNVVHIERNHFRMEDSKDYYGLVPAKSIFSRYAYPIKCTDVIIDDDNETVFEVRAESDLEKKMKQKGVLHCVAEPSPGADPLKVEVRLFDRLFHSEVGRAGTYFCGTVQKPWHGDLNPNSKVFVPEAFAVPSLRSAMFTDKFQFQRLGYCAVDKDLTLE